MIKILLAEDHKIVRNGIKTILEEEQDLAVTGEADNGVQALSLLEAGAEADILLTDISMPEMDGLTLANVIREKYPNIKVIVLSMMDNEKYIFDAFNFGIKAYMLKSVTTEELVFSIRHVFAGYEMISSELGMKMLRRASKSGLQGNNHTQPSPPELTTRELEILTLIGEGYTNSQIADKTFTSRRTVEGHRQNLLDKTGMKNTAQLIRYACKVGLL